MEDYSQYVAESKTELPVFSQDSTDTAWEFRFLLACDQFSHCKKESAGREGENIDFHSVSINEWHSKSERQRWMCLLLNFYLDSKAILYIAYSTL